MRHNELGQEQDEQQGEVIYCEGTGCGEAITTGDVNWIDDKPICDDCVGYREDQELAHGVSSRNDSARRWGF